MMDGDHNSLYYWCWKLSLLVHFLVKPISDTSGVNKQDRSVSIMFQLNMLNKYDPFFDISLKKLSIITTFFSPQVN